MSEAETNIMAQYGYVSLSSGADGAHDDEYDLSRGRLTDSTNYRYGGRQNPFDQRDDSPSGGGGYGAPMRGPPQQSFGSGPSPYGGSRYNNGPQMGRDQYGMLQDRDGRPRSHRSHASLAGTNVEMESLAQNAGGFGQSSDPNAILNECRSIDQGIDQIEQNLNQLRMLQERTLTDADTSANSATARQLDALSSETMTQYRSLTDRVRQVKSTPEGQTPKNSPQVGRVDRRLKGAIQQYQQVESQFRKRTQDQMARQYRIVRPDADEREVREAVEDAGAGAQIFQQAVMQSGRQQQANAVLSAVQDRQAALQKIEQQMVELAQLFQDMDVLVVQQEAAVTQIEQKGEEVVENLDKGNQEIGVAVNTARKTRKKKWWCLGICGKYSSEAMFQFATNSAQSSSSPSSPPLSPSTSPSSSPARPPPPPPPASVHSSSALSPPSPTAYPSTSAPSTRKRSAASCAESSHRAPRGAPTPYKTPLSSPVLVESGTCPLSATRRHTLPTSPTLYKIYLHTTFNRPPRRLPCLIIPYNPSLRLDVWIDFS